MDEKAEDRRQHAEGKHARLRRYAGTPGRVVRYDTKTKSGSKTIVDFIILSASRDRFAIVTLWGSTEEREENETGLAAIMASVRVAAETGSFWAGNSAAKPATGDKAMADAGTPAAPKAAAPAAPEAPEAPEGPNETRLAAYLFGTILQKTIQDCDIATTSRQREAIERKMVPLRAEMAPYQDQLKEVMKDMPACPPPGSESRMAEPMNLFIDKSPEDFAAAMDKAQQAAAAPQAKPAPASPPAAAAAAETRPLQPYGVRRAVFVTRAARYFGDVDVRPSNVFQEGEVLFSYVEPVGQSEKPLAGGQRQAGVTVDMEVRTQSGEVLGGKKGMSDNDITLNADQSIDAFYLNSDVTLSHLRPGSYTLVYVLKDKINGRTVEVPQAFSLVSSKTEATKTEATSTAPESRPAP
ncbi:hypothetical protein [Methylobacterium goesingense]|uniref:DUF4469 domain-containing protein n=1 Tax=Methylobacterium goesingense TaxID=243690 RepID=A0ABV2L5Q8_9HYPH|nr:hypothetical protein [Methylobacterium goesingense]GJD75256.1 hypothetical protein CFIICLFH_3497 [Methylobacterium goesingense]